MRYREKCELGAEATYEVPGPTSLSKAALNQVSKILMDADTVMLEMEIVNNFLMEDVIETVDNSISLDQLQMMEKELMDEIQVVHSYNDNGANFCCPQLIEHNSQYPQTLIDEYIADLANYAFGHP
nr:unnamed protein product [Digitaria exilis]